jgi:hypothetical protein
MIAVVEAQLKALEGLALSQVREIGWLTMFSFGPLHEHQRKKVLTSGVSIHADCPWRFVTSDAILVGSSDRWTPGSGAPTTAPKCWAESLAAERIADVVGGQAGLERERRLAGLGTLRVTRIRLDRYGGVRISFGRALVLEIVPTSADGEQWRYFRGGDLGSHVVMGPAVLLRAPPSNGVE